MDRLIVAQLYHKIQRCVKAAINRHYIDHNSIKLDNLNFSSK